MRFQTDLEAARAAYPFLIFSWKPEFSRRRPIDYSVDNVSYLEQVAYSIQDEESDSTEPLEDQEGLLRLFMNGGYEQFHVMNDEIILDFCRTSNFANIRAGTVGSNDKSRKVAWLDEKAFLNGAVLPKRTTKALTASELYRELKKPVSGPSNRGSFFNVFAIGR